MDWLDWLREKAEASPHKAGAAVEPARPRDADPVPLEHAPRSLLERALMASGWFWITDARGRTTFVSESFEALTGVPPEEVLGRAEWLEGRHLEPLMAERLARASQHHREFAGIEYRQDFAQEGRSPAWHIVTGIPIFDAQGVFRGYQGITRDISARKRAEARLQASEARYRQLADTTSDWLWVTNTHHQFTELSETHLRATGIVQLGLCRWELDGADIAENDWNAHRAVLDARHGFRDFEFARTLRGGEREWVSVSGAPRYDSSGDFLGYQGTGRYITERKQAELNLARSEERYRRLAALSADWEWISDAEHRFTHFSERATNLSGRDPQLALGRARWDRADVFMDADAAVWADHRRMLDARLPIRDFEYRRLGADGNVFWTAVSGDPVFDGHGAFVGYEGTARDITPRKLAQTRLERVAGMYAALSEADRALAEVQDAETAAAAVCRIIYEMGGLVRATFFRHDEATHTLVVAHHAGSGAPSISSLSLPPRGMSLRGDLPTVRAFLDGQSQVIDDYPGDHSTAPFHEAARRIGVLAGLAVPVRCDARVIGVLALFAGERRWFDPELVTLAARVCATLTRTVEGFGLAQRARETQEQLRASERRYRQFVDLAVDWYLETDPDGIVTYLAGAFTAHTAIPVEKRIGERIFSPPATIDPERFDAFWSLFKARQPVRDFLIQIHGINGEPWWRINAAPRYDDEGAFLGYAGTTRNVSAEIEATTALREAQEHFSRLAMLSVDWYWQTNADGLVTYVSESYQRNTGVDPATVLGRPCFPTAGMEPAGPAHEDEGEKAIWEAMRAREPFTNVTYPRRFYVRDGEDLWGVSSGEPVFSDDGTFQGYRGTARDVTEQVRAQRALRKYEAAAGARKERR